MNSPSLRLPSPIAELHDERVSRHGVRLYIKRDDLIHPELTGNKWRKLHYNLVDAGKQGHSLLLTFGGTYSNHISATAAAGHHFGFKTSPCTYVNTGNQFILNTHDYAEFCDRVAGRFIDHVPDEFTAPSAERRATADVLAPTVEAVKAAGLPFHPELWTSGEGQCSQCHAGCTNCGQGGDEDPAHRQS